MSVLLAEGWKAVELARPRGDELVARQPYQEITRLYVAVDSRGRRHLLLTLDEGHPSLADEGSRGLTVLTRDLELNGGKRSRYVDIVCESPIGHSMLDIVCGELSDLLRTSTETPTEVVTRVLAKWRRFWGQLPNQVLTQEAQAGLFAEVWFLCYWLLAALPPRDTLRAWRGPFGARHDFERPRLSVEVKATASTRGRIFEINGVDQLDPPQDGRLMFFGLRLREEAGASNTLPLLIETCRRQVQVDPDAEGLFETALITAGYISAHEDEYDKIHWRVVEELLFDVRDEFPRIVPASFRNGLPQGVEEMQYSVNLGSFDRLIVARRPDEAINILGSVHGA